ncbi:MAG: ribonuclease HIII [Methanobacterium sp.]|jgi:ribonuclease HIII|nr:MAG: ribonuclease HIII [Methanobacterium sp.]
MNSLTLSEIEVQMLKEYIETSNLERSPLTNEYELLRVKDQKVKLILYNSGKLVFNETNETLDILKSILIREYDYDYYLGSDETGKGEWYGPLVVVVTALTSDEILELRLLGVKDSKTMKTNRIIEIAQEIMEKNIPYEYIVLSPESYNKLYQEFENEGKSLNDLMAWAHGRAIRELLERLEYEKVEVTVDKFDQMKMENRLKGLDRIKVKVIQKTGGECKTPVAAASIIAKYFFEQAVRGLNNEYKLDLKNMIPGDINPEILPYVAKTHFKNVKNIIR